MKSPSICVRLPIRNKSLNRSAAAARFSGAPLYTGGVFLPHSVNALAHGPVGGSVSRRPPGGHKSCRPAGAAAAPAPHRPRAAAATACLVFLPGRRAPAVCKSDRVIFHLLDTNRAGRAAVAASAAPGRRLPRIGIS